MRMLCPNRSYACLSYLVLLGHDSSSILHARETRPASVHWLPLISWGTGGTPSIPELSDLAISELTKRLQRLGSVWKQKEARLLIPFHSDAAAAYQMVYPMGFDAHCCGNLRNRQRTRYPSWARPPVAMQSAMPQANQLHRAGEQLRVLRRAKSFRGQYLRNLLIRFPLAFQT